MNEEQGPGYTIVREALKRIGHTKTREQKREHFQRYMRGKHYRDPQAPHRAKPWRTMALDLGVTQATIKRWLAKFPEVVARVPSAAPCRAPRGDK